MPLFLSKYRVSLDKNQLKSFRIHVTVPRLTVRGQNSVCFLRSYHGITRMERVYCLCDFVHFLQTHLALAAVPRRFLPKSDLRSVHPVTAMNNTSSASTNHSLLLTVSHAALVTRPYN